MTKFKIEVKVWKSTDVGKKQIQYGDTHDVDKIDDTISLQDFFAREIEKIDSELLKDFEHIFDIKYNDPRQDKLDNHID